MRSVSRWRAWRVLVAAVLSAMLVATVAACSRTAARAPVGSAQGSSAFRTGADTSAPSASFAATVAGSSQSLQEWVRSLAVAAPPDDLPSIDVSTGQVRWAGRQYRLPGGPLAAEEVAPVVTAIGEDLLVLRHRPGTDRLIRLRPPAAVSQVATGLLGGPAVSPDADRYALVETDPSGRNARLVVRAGRTDRVIATQKVAALAAVFWGQAGLVVLTPPGDKTPGSVQLYDPLGGTPPHPLPVDNIEALAARSDRVLISTDAAVGGPGVRCHVVTTLPELRARLRRVCDTDTPNADLQSKSLSPDGRLLLVGLQVIDIDTGRVTALAAHAPGPAQVNQVLTAWETNSRVALRIGVDGHNRARGQWIVRCTLPTGTCNRERNPVPGI